MRLKSEKNCSINDVSGRRKSSMKKVPRGSSACPGIKFDVPHVEDVRGRVL